MSKVLQARKESNEKTFRLPTYNILYCHYLNLSLLIHEPIIIIVPYRLQPTH